MTKEHYVLPELESCILWVRALPNYRLQDEVFYRSRVNRMQFEELLGRPAPSFVEAPKRLSLVEQLLLVEACREYGWTRKQEVNLNQLRTNVSLSTRELAGAYCSFFHSFEESVAAQFGVALWEAGYLRRKLNWNEPSPNAYQELRLSYSLDLEPQGRKYSMQDTMMGLGNAFFDAAGRRW